MKRIKRQAKKRLGWFEQLEILPYRGYGTPDRLFVSGRVLESKGVVEKSPVDDEPVTADGITADDPWSNLRATIRRFRSDEIPGAELEARLGNTRLTLTTDEEGYFATTLRPERPLAPGWHQVHLSIVSSMAGGQGVQAWAEVLVPPADASFGIISDIDDTVVHSSVTDRLRMIRIVLFQSAHTRIPFPGVAAFYRALKQGPDGRGHNPIFYVSKSPWNLYDLFDTFFEIHDMPRGPLFLRDFATLEAASRSLGTGQDKLTRIRMLLNVYPKMQFVLLGDSGQQDPEIYQQIALEHPGRIKAIYIRNVTSFFRAEQVCRIAEEIRSAGIPLVLASDTAEAAEHAAELGLIAPSSLAAIGRRARKDEQEG